MTSPESERALRLLSFDGGGIRGLSGLLIVKEIMYRIQKEENDRRRKDNQEQLKGLPKPCEYFDLICGTSTGGIIALMLGRLRMDVDKAIDTYAKLVEEVFSKPKRWGGNGLFSATKLEEAMKLFINEELGDPESRLLEDEDLTICRTFVCAKNAHNLNIPVRLRTYRSSETPIDCTIWQAARATSATPTFFKHIEIGRDQPYIDGGIGANNPTFMLLDEARMLFPNRKIGCLISIGTGHPKPADIPTRGPFPQLLPKDIVDTLTRIATDCDAIHQDMYSRFANSRNTYFRLNVEQGMQGVKLSEWEKLSKVEAHTIQYMKDGLVKDIFSVLVGKIRMPVGELTAGQIISPLPPPLPSLAKHQAKIRQRPHSVSTFTGRREIIDKMHSYFKSDSNSQHIYILHGLGGAGKTQIALKFLEESEESARFSDIFYIDATNEETIVSYLTAIAPEGVEKSVDMTLAWLTGRRANQNWLLFFDNADDIKLNLGQFFPDCAHGNVLVTSRNRGLRSIGDCTDEPVKDMTLDDAMYLLFRRSGKERTTENEVIAEKIVNELHCFALAIAQAGAYIRSRSISFQHFWDLHSEQHNHLLQHHDIQGKDPAVYATWRLSFDQLDEPAKVFLQICSLLHHEGISEEIFKRAALSQHDLDDPELERAIGQLLGLLGRQDSEWKSHVFQKIVDLLSAYSLIDYDEYNRSYRIHSLVQGWGYDTLGDTTHSRCREVVTILALSVHLGDDYIYQHLLLPHIFTIMKLITLPEISTNLGDRIGYVYKWHGYWKEAEALEVVVFLKRKERLGEDHPDTLRSMGSLARTYSKQGQWKEAEALQLEVLLKKKESLGEDHPDTLTSMGNLARTYSEQGQWKEAEALQIVVLQKTKERLGEDHPDTLTSMGNLAHTYTKQSQWEEAEALEVVVLQKTRERLGENHPDTLISMGNLAYTYSKQGQWKEAEALQIEALQKMMQILGEDHPNTLTSMGNLARTYSEQGQWKKAKALEAVVLQKSKERLGENHPNTLSSMGNLAATYWNLGQWKEAEALQVVVLQESKERLGEDHLSTLLSMGNLAQTYIKQGQWTEAEALQVVVLKKTKERLGEDHPDTLTSMGNLARTYSDQGQWKEAEALEVVVLERSKERLGEDHPSTLLSMRNLARTYSGQGQWKEAEALQIVALQKTRERLGEDHPTTLTSMQNLATTYWNQGRWKEAEALEVVVLQKTRERLGEDHPSTLFSMGSLAETYKSLGQLEDAAALQAVLREKGQ